MKRKRASRTDVMTVEQRSQCMSRIRGKDTGPEMKLRLALWSRGLRYRLHYNIPGRPDVVFPGKRIAIFVDGCFWHGCPLHGVRPKTNAVFWHSKIQGNIRRDAKVTKILGQLGWCVFRFWEHQIEDGFDTTVSRVLRAITNAQTRKAR